MCPPQPSFPKTSNEKRRELLGDNADTPRIDDETVRIQIVFKLGVQAIPVGHAYYKASTDVTTLHFNQGLDFTPVRLHLQVVLEKKLSDLTKNAAKIKKLPFYSVLNHCYSDLYAARIDAMQGLVQQKKQLTENLSNNINYYTKIDPSSLKLLQQLELELQLQLQLLDQQKKHLVHIMSANEQDAIYKQQLGNFDSQQQLSPALKQYNQEVVQSYQILQTLEQQMKELHQQAEQAIERFKRKKTLKLSSYDYYIAQAKYDTIQSVILQCEAHYMQLMQSITQQVRYFKHARQQAIENTVYSASDDSQCAKTAWQQLPLLHRKSLDQEKKLQSELPDQTQLLKLLPEQNFAVPIQLILKIQNTWVDNPDCLIPKKITFNCYDFTEPDPSSSSAPAQDLSTLPQPSTTEPDPSHPSAPKQAPSTRPQPSTFETLVNQAEVQPSSIGTHIEEIISDYHKKKCKLKELNSLQRKVTQLLKFSKKIKEKSKFNNQEKKVLNNNIEQLNKLPSVIKKLLEDEKDEDRQEQLKKITEDFNQTQHIFSKKSKELNPDFAAKSVFIRYPLIVLKILYYVFAFIVWGKEFAAWAVHLYSTQRNESVEAFRKRNQTQHLELFFHLGWFLIVMLTVSAITLYYLSAFQLIEPPFAWVETLITTQTDVADCTLAFAFCGIAALTLFWTLSPLVVMLAAVLDHYFWALKTPLSLNCTLQTNTEKKSIEKEGKAQLNAFLKQTSPDEQKTKRKTFLLEKGIQYQQTLTHRENIHTATYLGGTLGLMAAVAWGVGLLSLSLQPSLLTNAAWLSSAYTVFGTAMTAQVITTTLFAASSIVAGIFLGFSFGVLLHHTLGKLTVQDKTLNVHYTTLHQLLCDQAGKLSDYVGFTTPAPASAVLESIDDTKDLPPLTTADTLYCNSKPIDNAPHCSS